MVGVIVVKSTGYCQLICGEVLVSWKGIESLQYEPETDDAKSAEDIKLCLGMKLKHTSIIK